MVNIQHNFMVNAPVVRVYEAITTLDGLRRWWTKETTGNPDKDGEIRFGFGEEFYNKMKVSALTKDASVAWDCTDGPPDWLGTQIIFTLSEQKNGCSVKFEHKGWKEANDFYGMCNYHWGLYMKSLKLLCETGKGTPHIADVKAM